MHSCLGHQESLQPAGRALDAQQSRLHSGPRRTGSKARDVGPSGVGAPVNGELCIAAVNGIASQAPPLLMVAIVVGVAV